MDIVKALIVLAFSFGVAQFSCASVSVVDIASAGSLGLGGTNSRISDSTFFNNYPDRPAFAVSSLQGYASALKDPIFEPAINEAVDSGTNPRFGSSQSAAWNIDGDKSGLPDASSWSAGLSPVEFGMSAAPETDTWVMLMVAVGLIGYQLKRSQRSLFRAALPSIA